MNFREQTIPELIDTLSDLTKEIERRYVPTARSEYAKWISSIEKELQKPVNREEYLEWELFLRGFEGSLAIHTVVRERILRKMFNTKC